MLFGVHSWLKPNSSAFIYLDNATASPTFSTMPDSTDPRPALREILLKKSVMRGDFTLASGAKSDLYVDCRLTTLDAQGAVLIGKAMLSVLREAEAATGAKPVGVGGLTMGADPVALAISIASYQADPSNVINAFSVRKEAKKHGRQKLVEGNFKAGDSVVVVDDVITTGGSTIKAIESIEAEGGKIAFVLVLLDREEGGRAHIEALGHRVFSAFTRTTLLS
jgi:orotate phosphoribosyltransferase